MAKRELIDRKALIDNGLSKGFCEWYDEIKQAEVITEQEIVKPYLDRLKEQIRYDYNRNIWGQYEYEKVMDCINNLTWTENEYPDCEKLEDCPLVEVEDEK